MEITTARKRCSGDPALLELGVVADGYWSDRTRAKVAGKPNNHQEMPFHLVIQAQEAAIKAIKPGVLSEDVDETARSVLRDAGYAGEYLHVTGHGVGFRHHEPIPLIAPNGKIQLEAGMVHSVEPGIYSPEWGGVRFEDDVVVTVSGSEVLGPL